MSDTYENELRVAVQAVREAAGLCRAVQARISPAMLEKKDRSPVTVADFGSQAIVCRALSEAFGGDPVIAEEDSAALRETANAPLLEKVLGHVQTAQSDPGCDTDAVCRWIDHGGAGRYSDRFWTLDPIDGTKGFLRGEQYAIALALIVDGQVAVAALGCPNLPMDGGANAAGGTIFTAVRGGGAAVQPLSGGSPTPIHVSKTTDPSQARFCESVESGHSSHSDAATIAQRLGITSEPVRLDSQAKYAVVARGEADIYMRLPTRADYVEKIWDHAAGVLVIEEAGGKASDINGKPLEFTHGRQLDANKGVIVTNGPLHAPVLSAINQVGVA